MYVTLPCADRVSLTLFHVSSTVFLSVPNLKEKDCYVCLRVCVCEKGKERLANWDRVKALKRKRKRSRDGEKKQFFTITL